MSRLSRPATPPHGDPWVLVTPRQLPSWLAWLVGWHMLSPWPGPPSCSYGVELATPQSLKYSTQHGLAPMQILLYRYDMHLLAILSTPPPRTAARRALGSGGAAAAAAAAALRAAPAGAELPVAAAAATGAAVADAAVDAGAGAEWRAFFWVHALAQVCLCRGRGGWADLLPVCCLLVMLHTLVLLHRLPGSCMLGLHTCSRPSCPMALISSS